MANDISKFYRSFSGTDSLAFIILPNASPVLLGSLTTVSYSTFRDKKPVPLIGKINVGGFTRGTRIYAGTMIFTMINQHWINDLLEQIPWLKSYGRIKADELPLFDIMIISSNEYGASVQMFIYGVDITDEGQVLSIEDMFTENQFSFIARDLDTFSNDAVPKMDFVGKNTITKIRDFDLQYNSSLNSGIFSDNGIPLSRNLGYNNLDMLTGDDVLQIQHLLNKAGVNVNMTGIYDPKTFEAVKQFQSSVGLPVTGSISDETFKILDGSKVSNTKPIGVIISKSGAFIYDKPSSSSIIVDKLNYKDSIEVIGENNEWYKFDKGNVLKSHVFLSTNKYFTDFNTLRFGSKGKDVVMIQEALNSVMKTNIPVSGVIDKDTTDLIKGFEKIMGLAVDGIIDKNDFLVLQEKANMISKGTDKNDNYILELVSIPRTVKYDLENFKFDNEGILLKNIKGDGSVKLSAISYYNNKSKAKVYSTTLIFVKGDQNLRISPRLLQDAFLYNGDYKGLPEYVEFIIFPIGSEPMKWIYKFN